MRPRTEAAALFKRLAKALYFAHRSRLFQGFHNVLSHSAKPTLETRMIVPFLDFAFSYRKRPPSLAMLKRELSLEVIDGLIRVP
jgi:hypothetical protein